MTTSSISQNPAAKNLIQNPAAKNLIQNPQTSADDKYNQRLLIDMMCPLINFNKLGNFLNKLNNNGTSIWNMGNNPGVDANGILKPSAKFTSFKAISNLKPEDKEQLEKYEREIADLQNLQAKLAKDKADKKEQTQTLAQIFKEKGLETKDIDQKLLESKDATVIQEQLEKAIKEKEEKLAELKKKCFGDNIPDDDIKLENIDAGEKVILGQKVEKYNKKHAECEQLAKDIKDLEEKTKQEIQSVKENSSLTDQQKAERIQKIEKEANDKKTEMVEKKSKAEDDMKKAMEAAEKYGTAAAKDGSSIDADGKAIPETEPDTTLGQQIDTKG